MRQIRSATQAAVLVLPCAVAAACRGAGGGAAAPAPRAAAAAEVRAAAEGWRHAFEAKDIGRIVGIFEDDALAMYPLPQPTVGRAANVAAWTAYYARPNATHPLTTDTVVVAASGDLAYTVGRWRATYDRPGTTPGDDGGRYLAVWRRGRTGWRIAALSANAHQPPPAIP